MITRNQGKRNLRSRKSLLLQGKKCSCCSVDNESSGNGLNRRASSKSLGELNSNAIAKKSPYQMSKLNQVSNGIKGNSSFQKSKPFYKGSCFKHSIIETPVTKEKSKPVFNSENLSLKKSEISSKRTESRQSKKDKILSFNRVKRAGKKSSVLNSTTNRTKFFSNTNTRPDLKSNPVVMSGKNLFLKKLDDSNLRTKIGGTKRLSNNSSDPNISLSTKKLKKNMNISFNFSRSSSKTPRVRNNLMNSASANDKTQNSKKRKKRLDSLNVYEFSVSPRIAKVKMKKKVIFKARRKLLGAKQNSVMLTTDPQFYNENRETNSSHWCSMSDSDNDSSAISTHFSKEFSSILPSLLDGDNSILSQAKNISNVSRDITVSGECNSSNSNKSTGDSGPSLSHGNENFYSDDEIHHDEDCIDMGITYDEFNDHSNYKTVQDEIKRCFGFDTPVLKPLLPVSHISYRNESCSPARFSLNISTADIKSVRFNRLENSEVSWRMQSRNEKNYLATDEYSEEEKESQPKKKKALTKKRAGKRQPLHPLDTNSTRPNTRTKQPEKEEKVDQDLIAKINAHFSDIDSSCLVIE